MPRLALLVAMTAAAFAAAPALAQGDAKPPPSQADRDRIMAVFARKTTPPPSQGHILIEAALSGAAIGPEFKLPEGVILAEPMSASCPGFIVRASLWVPPERVVEVRALLSLFAWRGPSPSKF